MTNMTHMIYYQEHTRPISDSEAIPLRAILAVSETAEPFISLDRETVNAIGAMDNRANSDKIGRSLEVGVEYLKEFCKVVSQEEAEAIHPNLFLYVAANQPS